MNLVKNVTRIYFLFILIGILIPVRAQELTLFNIDTSAYPTIKADFYAIDQFKKQRIDLNTNDVFITENTFVQEVTKVSNPSALVAKPISLVLTVDVSNSMHGQFIRLARNAATAIVDNLPLAFSECAITSFDDESYVHTDFTRSKSKLQVAIQTLVPRNGTDYDVGFMKQGAGGLDILKKGMHEKVLIFLTDGYGKVNPQEITKKAQAINAKVYVITMGMNTPDELKQITRQTNGLYFENIQSDEQIQGIYLSILYQIQGLLPSKVEWESTSTCAYEKNILFGDKKNIFKKAKAFYETSVERNIRLISDKNRLVLTDSNKNVAISLRAVNGMYTIKSFTISSPLFKITMPILPMEIKKDSVRSIILSYEGKSGEYVSGSIECVSTGCPSYFIYFQYIPTSGKASLKLLNPIGGEVFYTHSDLNINWDRQQVDEHVKISFSSNAGKEWITLNDTNQSEKYTWRIPNKPGKENLIKIEALHKTQENNATFKIIHDKFSGVMNAYNLSPDGSRYISQTPVEIYLRDTRTNAIINKVKNTIQNGYYIFSPDGKYIYFYDEGKPIEVYDAFTFEFIERKGVFNTTLSSYIEPYINDDLTAYIGKEKSGSFAIFDFITGIKLNSLEFIKGKEITDFTKKYIITIDQNNHIASIWDYVNRKRILELTISTEQIVNAEFNKDQTILFVSTWNAVENIQVFTAYDLTGKTLYVFKNSAKSFMSLDTYQSYGLCSVNNYPTLIDLQTGKTIVTYVLPTDVKFGWFVPFSNGYYILFTNAVSKEVYLVSSGIEKVEKIYLKDQNTVPFTIASTKPILTPFNFNSVYVGDSRDSIFQLSIKNTTSQVIQISKMEIDGKDATSFKVLNPISVSTITPNSALPIEVRFMPNREGLNQARLKIYTKYDTTQLEISGKGVLKSYSLNKTELDFGAVLVGSLLDTTFSKLLTNTTKSNLNIRAIKLIGPDQTQFSLVSPSTLTLKPGTSIEVKIRFTPIERGRTSTVLQITTNDALYPIALPIYGEGVQPRKYILNYTIKDDQSKNEIDGSIVVTDIEANVVIRTIGTQEKTNATIVLYADRTYAVAVIKEGYKTYTDTINLKGSIKNDTITKSYTLTLNENASASYTQTIKGIVFDKERKRPLEASVLIYSKVGHSLVQKVTCTSEGFYTVQLPLGLYTFQVEMKAYINAYVDVHVKNAIDIDTNFYLIPIKVGEVLQLPNVYFERGGVDLLADSDESLDKLYALLNDNPYMQIELFGYTDNQGNPNLNIDLSEKRVAAIKTYLVSKGITESRIFGKGYGGSKPIASNATEETRKLNRRVEFKILKK